jgi:RecB family exonuclease
LRRWWRLNRPLDPRDRESYTSLEKFIYSPYAWVLRYKAKLKAGPLATVRLEGNTSLKGTLLHRLLELLLAERAEVIDWRTTTQLHLSHWLDNQWPRLLEQEGASLLLPGKVAEAAALLALARDALWELLRQVRAAGVVTAATNVNLPVAPFSGCQIEGFLDMFVATQKGRVAVIDLKFGGHDVRQQELRENRELQLAVYGFLVNQSRGTWPEGAFYILTRRRLLARSQEYFPHARIIASRSAPGGLRNCWFDFEQVWRWRRRQLDAGWIEVTAEDTNDRPADAPDSTPPIPHWQATEDHAKYNEFDALTGWTPDA